MVSRFSVKSAESSKTSSSETRTFSSSPICTRALVGTMNLNTPLNNTVVPANLTLSWNPVNFGVNCNGANNRYLLYVVWHYDLSLFRQLSQIHLYLHTER